jgi:hypothetical protein
MDPVCEECTIETKCGLHAKDEHHDCGCGGKDGACECSDGKQEENMTTETPNVKENSEAENIVEREFASLRTQLEEMTVSKAEINTQYEDALKLIEEFKLAEEERAAKEAEARKVSVVEAILSKELIFGTLEEDKKEARHGELTAWEEPRLTGFSEALAALPVPEDTERTFGKGKSTEGEAVPAESERKFAVKLDKKTGRIKIDPDVLRGN